MDESAIEISAGYLREIKKKKESGQGTLGELYYPDDWAELVQKYRNGEITEKEIAEKCGITAFTFYRRIKKEGIGKRPIYGRSQEFAPSILYEQVFLCAYCIKISRFF